MLSKLTITYGLSLGILMVGGRAAAGGAAQIQQQDISPTKTNLQLAIEDLIHKR